MPTESHLVVARAHRLLVRVRRGTAGYRSARAVASLGLDAAPFDVRFGLVARTGETGHAPLDRGSAGRGGRGTKAG